jgi:predicted metal-dependent phosphoesterase TrpH
MAKVVADMHVHSRASDGMLTYAQIVDRTRKKNSDASLSPDKIGVLAFTDHNNIDFEALQKLLERLEQEKSKSADEIEIIPGIEIKVSEPESGIDKLELLAYFPYASPGDIANSDLWEIIEKRNRRQREVCRKVYPELERAGFKFDPERNDLSESEIAVNIFETQKGLYESVKQVLQLMEDRSIDARELAVGTVDEVIALIRDADGIPVLAHPGRARVERRHVGLLVLEKEKRRLRHFRNYIGRKVKAGLMGIECPYSYNRREGSFSVVNPSQKDDIIDHFLNIAIINHLLITGGSDFHETTRGELGVDTIDYTYVKRLKDKAKKIFY